MISVIDLAMRFGAKILFQNVNLQFNPGYRYGLVGANGSGKSTFIKILTKEITPEQGDVHLPTQFSIGFLKQDQYLYEEEQLLDVVLRGKPKLWEALERKNELLKKEHFSEQECRLLDQLEETIIEQEGYTATSEAAKLLEGLGIKEAWHRKPLRLQSGGYKLRVLLAKVLFGHPDILVLDEPTNHLDVFSIKWLEGYLKNFAGTLILSSHDREFLNGICTHIADVDYGTIKIYKGNYDEFLERKEEDREQKELLFEKQDKKRGEIQGFIDRFKAKASKARQAQSKARLVEKLVEEMDSLDFSPSSRLYPHLDFSPMRSSGATPLVVKNISKSYDIKKVLHQVSFEIERGDRLAILGPNGIGKSTLLSILMNHLQSDEGSFEWGFATRVAYFPQDHAKEVNGTISLIDWLGNYDPTLNQEQLREILARVLFSGDTVKQAVSTLSGGEAARLILAKMLMQKPNVLIFDEPTNHLDMEAIDELTRALKEFDGTIVFVSHNRYFVSQVASRILEITEKGVRDFKMTYPEYIEKQELDFLSSNKKQHYIEEPVKQVVKQEGTSYEDQKRLRNLKSQLKKKISQAEEECQRLEGEIRTIDQTMAQEGFYQNANQEEQQKLFKKKQTLEQLLLDAMNTWETASIEFQQVEIE